MNSIWTDYLKSELDFSQGVVVCFWTAIRIAPVRLKMLSHNWKHSDSRSLETYPFSKITDRGKKQIEKGKTIKQRRKQLFDAL